MPGPPRLRTTQRRVAAGLLASGLVATGLLGLVLASALSAHAGPTAHADRQARRVVSMNPSLTAILLALDAAPVLVGVDEYSAKLHPTVSELPVVGGLFNPSVEAVVALQPDLVVLVPSAQQRDFRRLVEELGIEVLELPNITVEDILASIETLGARTHHSAAARARVAQVRDVFARVRAATQATPRRSALVVLQRDPLYVVGRGSFIDEMLRAAGLDNAAEQLDEPYPRAALEWVIATAPEIILDATSGGPSALEYWSRWPSIPAVEQGRALAIPASLLTYPGPFLEDSLLLVARSAHGPEFLRDALARVTPAGGELALPDATAP